MNNLIVVSWGIEYFQITTRSSKRRLSNEDILVVIEISFLATYEEKYVK
jgi:hypothetical protein